MSEAKNNNKFSLKEFRKNNPSRSPSNNNNEGNNPYNNHNHNNNNYNYESIDLTESNSNQTSNNYGDASNRSELVSSLLDQLNSLQRNSGEIRTNSIINNTNNNFNNSNSNIHTIHDLQPTSRNPYNNKSNEGKANRNNNANNINTNTNPEIKDDLIDEFVENHAAVDVFSSYECKSLSFGNKHPGFLTEATTLAAIPLPKPTYPLLDSIDPDIINSTKLSDLQLESVLYAAQRHQMLLSNGTRAGFFIADSAGVGKGRQLAGLILDSYCRGRTKHIWISASQDLALDAARDLKDIGCCIPVIKGPQALHSKSNKYSTMDTSHGVLFTTYNTLISAGGKQGKRLDQIVNWAGGKEFEGLLLFDESHRAKNYKEGDKACTQTGKRVVELQELLPRARVVYCSATGISELHNLGFMIRLGLYGKSTTFPDFQAFLTNIQKRGIGAFELLSMEMKGLGIYLSRGLSYQNCEFINITADLTEKQVECYNQAANCWRLLRKSLQHANDVVYGLTKPSQIWKQFFSTQQRFFKQLCVSSKVPAIVAEAKKYRNQGFAIVIGLQQTGETSLKNELKKGDNNSNNSSNDSDEDYESDDDGVLDLTNDQFSCSTKESLVRFIQQYFVVEKKTPQYKYKVFNLSTNQTEEKISTSATSKEEFAKQNNIDLTLIQDEVKVEMVTLSIPTLVHTKQTLLDYAKSLTLPSSPLDSIIDELGGPNEVAEMTGRKYRQIRDSRTGEIKTQHRDGSSIGGVIIKRNKSNNGDLIENVNIKEQHAFMNGQKYVAIISDAASTGISLHSDARCVNQRRRLHLTLELAWSADKTIQQLGRSHRSNEVTGPIYGLVNTNLGGEKRFAAAVAKRLQSLGALTKGDRRAATSNNLEDSNFDTIYGRKALRDMFKSIFYERPILPHLNLDQASESDKKFGKLTPQQLSQFKENLLSVGLESDSTEKGTISKFFNRLLGLEVEPQNKLFEYFCWVMDFTIAQAKRDGTFDNGVTDVHGDITLQDSVKIPCYKLKDGLTEFQLPLSVSRTNPTGSRKPEAQYNEELNKYKQAILDQGVELDEKFCETTHITLQVDRGVSFETAKKRLNTALESNPHEYAGFYKSKREFQGKHWVMLAIPRVSNDNSFQLTRPATGTNNANDMDKIELFNKYNLVNDIDSIEELWNEGYEETKDCCSHGINCKNRPYCQVGKRIQTNHLLCGHVLNYFSVLSDLAAKHTTSLNSNTLNNQMRVVRVELNNGEIVCGLRVPVQIMKDFIEMLPEFQLKYNLCQNLSIESVAPVSTKYKKMAYVKTKTLNDFFADNKNKNRNNNIKQELLGENYNSMEDDEEEGEEEEEQVWENLNDFEEYKPKKENPSFFGRVLRSRSSQNTTDGKQIIGENKNNNVDIDLTVSPSDSPQKALSSNINDSSVLNNSSVQSVTKFFTKSENKLFSPNTSGEKSESNVYSIFSTAARSISNKKLTAKDRKLSQMAVQKQEIILLDSDTETNIEQTPSNNNTANSTCNTNSTNSSSNSIRSMKRKSFSRAILSIESDKESDINNDVTAAAEEEVGESVSDSSSFSINSNEANSNSSVMSDDSDFLPRKSGKRSSFRAKKQKI